MIAGLNRIFEHEGREFHIQVEDLGEKQASFEVRVHSGGGIVWQKKMSYAETLAKGLPKGELDEAVSSAMEKALHTVQAAIARGKLPCRRLRLHSSADASRLAALLVGCIFPICALLAPCQPGASTLSVRHRISGTRHLGGRSRAPDLFP